MTKKQKVWFWIGLGLFVVPEILWLPASNLLNSLYQNSNKTELLVHNWLTRSDYANWLSLLLFLQFMGALTTGVNLVRSQASLLQKIFGLILLVISGIIFILFILSFSIRNVGF